MSQSVIIGEGKPRIVCDGVDIDLPYCDFITEGYTLDSNSHKLSSGDIYNNKKGWYYFCKLSYDKRITKTVLQSLEPLLDITNGEFKLYPRVDNLGYSFTVEFSEDFIFQFRQKAFHRNHAGIVIEFNAVNRSQVILSTPTLSDGYGYDYGYFYGDGL